MLLTGSTQEGIENVCERVAVVVLEKSMSEYVSVIATTEGPLHIYAAPGLSSHGDARAGWKIVGGAEVEWTGENHDSMTVRYEDDRMAVTIKAMLQERFATRAEMVATIFETRGPGGTSMWYPRNLKEFDEISARDKFPNVGFANLRVSVEVRQLGNVDLRGYNRDLPLLASIVGSVHLKGYNHTLPLLASIGGAVYLEGYAHDLPLLSSIGENAYLRGYDHALPLLASIGGSAYLRGYGHSLPLLDYIGGDAYLKNYDHPLPLLDFIGRTADLEGYAHALPLLHYIGGNAYLSGYAHDLPRLIYIGWKVFVEGYNHALPLLDRIGVKVVVGLRSE